MVFPWKIRRVLLNKAFGYKVHKNASIGFSIIIPEYLEMHEGARIGNLNVCKGLELLVMGNQSRIGKLNWITGLRKEVSLKSYTHNSNRHSALILSENSAITNRHIIDCTDKISIGKYSVVAGFRSQFLTHSIDFEKSQQDCASIAIGDYCFIGTGCVVLPGSALGNYSILGALSLLNDSFKDEYVLFGGVPAKKIKILNPDLAYFNRLKGFVD